MAKSAVNTSRYPQELSSFRRLIDGVDEVEAKDYNDLCSMIEAIQDTIGLGAHGSASSISARISRSIDDEGKLKGWRYTRITGGGDYIGFFEPGEFSTAPHFFGMAMDNPNPQGAGFIIVGYGISNLINGIRSYRKGGGANLPNTSFTMGVLFTEYQ